MNSWVHLTPAHVLGQHTTGFENRAQGHKPAILTDLSSPQNTFKTELGKNQNAEKAGQHLRPKPHLVVAYQNTTNNRNYQTKLLYRIKTRPKVSGHHIWNSQAISQNQSTYKEPGKPQFTMEKTINSCQPWGHTDVGIKNLKQVL